MKTTTAAFLGLAAIVAAAPLAAAATSAAGSSALDSVPRTILVDQAGARLAFPDSRPWLVTFFYTTCQDECPRELEHLKAVYQALPASDREKIRAAAITLDPDHDGPGALARTARAHDLSRPSFEIASGNAADLGRLYRAFRVPHSQGDDGEILHANLIALVGPDGRVVRHFWGTSTNPAQVAALVHRALQ